MVRIALAAFLALASQAAAETVDVKYQGEVDLSTFACPSIKDSSFVNRICYHEGSRYMVVLLKETYYHYCEIGPNVVAEFIAADSLGRFYNTNIRGSSNDGLYDCRKYEVPQF